jgi:hypothetical protein
VEQNFSIHRFRTSFAVWAVKNKFPPHLIDFALSHAIGGTMSRSYIPPEAPKVAGGGVWVVLTWRGCAQALAANLFQAAHSAIPLTITLALLA